MQTLSQTTQEKKIVIVGDGGVGKSTYVKKLLNGNFEKRYSATLGVEVYPLTIYGNKYCVWDTAGQEKFGGLRDGYYMDADYGIIMCSESKLTQKSIKGWYEDLKRVNPDIKIILLCNKSELGYELVENIEPFLRNNNIDVNYISVKENIAEDLFKILRQFLN